MPPGSPSSGRVRGFLKRVTHGAKKVFKPSDQAPASQTSSPPPRTPPADPHPQLTPSREPDPGILPQPTARSQQSATVAQLQPNTQPTPSTLSLAADGNEAAKAESSLTLVAKKAGADAWSALRLALQLLKESSDVFPPVKSAVAGFLGVVDIFESAAQNRKDYAELASNLQSMVNEFKDHPGEHTSSKMSEAVMAVASGLEEEMRRVEEQQQRSGIRRHLEARQDVDDVQECYRRVETLCRELQNKALIKIWRNQEEQQVDARLKELNAALKAMYDSSLSDVVGRRMCTPGTRESILAEMRQWADDPKAPKVYWLNGMAGTGKTTLAYSFCAEMQLAHRLGASFFCSRTDADSRDVSKIVPAIAHQLARLLPSYREALIRQIGEDKDIGVRNTKAQFEKLIRDPLREVMSSVPEGVVVAIDALDECDRRDGAQAILNVLLLSAKDLPVKFFVTCRPEPGLFDMLESGEEHRPSVLHLHDIEASFVQADIKTYLEAELGGISLSQEKLGRLAEQAGTLFIYAATAVRYIRPKSRRVNFSQRLEELLSVVSKTGTNKHKGIDDLYTAVLAAPFGDEDLEAREKETMRLVLDTAICAREPMGVTTMAKLLGLDDDAVLNALQHLRSVLHVSQDADLISTLHASFPDFMLDDKRSKKLGCNAAKHNQHLALCCFGSMKRLLRFNICELESSFILDENIPGLTKKIDQAISPELFYACGYWGAHLEFAEALDDFRSAVEDFLSTRLLFWMEVMNLRNSINAGAQMLTHVHRWLQRLGGAKDAVELSMDAGRFVTAFGLSPASRSTPHIYMSALPFWPETRPVSVRYWERTKHLIRPKGSGMEGRDLSCLAKWNIDSTIGCIAFSPDGTRIASGSEDNYIRVLNAHNGDLVAGPLKGHAGRVTSVAFSPDSTRIVSGSRDSTIRVWDAGSGDLVGGPFEGHTQSVNSVAFSPSGTRIVSGSDDNTIQVLDAHSGNIVVGRFHAHRSWVSSVAFSPDGTRILSGSHDRTICVWDACSGDPIGQPLKGHTDWVRSVAFSPDGTRIISGADDNHILIWDAQSGDLVDGPIEGHTESVSSVAFSPDSTHIVSGSYDHTICVWDAQSGDLVTGPLVGHTNLVSSVAFSPDGTHIVSGSHDNTICVWDAHSGLLVAGSFEGHIHSVNSVAFSLDGTRIVSVSNDYNACIWDAQSGDLVDGPYETRTNGVKSIALSPDSTRLACSIDSINIHVRDTHRGDLVAGPFRGHTDWVASVVFSPDGTHIASGSDDSTIRVWDAYSRDLVAGPLEGHTSSVKSVAFSPDGTRIVSGSLDHTIRAWDAQSGDLVAGPLEGHTSSVNSVAFSPDGTMIVSGSSDRTIRVWDAQSGDLVAGPLEGHTNSVNSVAFSPDGTIIVSGSSDRTIRVWVAAPLHVHNPTGYNNWTMDKTGTITTQQGQLLLCVPADLWTGIVRPENTVCIYNKGVVKLDFDNVVMGKQWVQCYRGSERVDVL